MNWKSKATYGIFTSRHLTSPRLSLPHPISTRKIKLKLKLKLKPKERDPISSSFFPNLLLEDAGVWASA
jgi:hypothetical protein